MDTPITIRSDALTVTVAAKGAELRSITDAQGGEWLWDGDARWWTGRAPILFPTVGVTAGGARFGGTLYPLGKHGFARDREFEAVATDDGEARFRLVADADTRAAYPFDFVLEIAHALAGATLTTTATVTNAGDTPMPFGFGFHPALHWPLPGTGALSRTDHIVRFDADEPGPLRLIGDDGLIQAGDRPTPVRDNELHLRDDLFSHDALVWEGHASRGLFYGVDGHPGVRVDFAGLDMLGIWTKPGAGYLCIEPWASRADDEGFAGEFADKPGVRTLPPGASHSYAMSLTIAAPI